MSSEIRQLPEGRFFGRRRTCHEGRGFLVSESRYRADEALPPHAHQRAHFCLVVAGRYTEWVDAGEAARRAGDLLFYAAGTDHAETHHEAGHHLLIEIDDRLAGRLPAGGSASDGVRSCGGAARWIAGRLLVEAEHEDGAAPLAVEGLMLQLLAATARSAAAGSRPAWIDRGRELLRGELASPPSIDELARRLGLPTGRLERDLRRWEDTTLAALVRRLRVEVAAERLISSDESLAEIALGTGYCDQSHFTRAFRAATGSTPGAYRRAFLDR